MTRIIACYVICNEERLIAESLRSVKAYVDGYVIVDVVFPGNPINATHSTDATRAICEYTCYPLPLTYVESSMKMTEQQARNLYISKVKDGDWILWLDGDETVLGHYFTVLSLFKDIREGKIKDAISIRVHTTAVLCDGLGKDVTEQEYVTNPYVSTCGWSTKLYQKREGYHHQLDRVVRDGERTIIYSENACYDANNVLVTNRRNPSESLFVINQHLHQSHEEYVADCIWALNQRPERGAKFA